MEDTQHHRLIILGAGPAGYTAAVYAARANLNPVVITGNDPGGQLMTTTDVDNWPADTEGVQGPDLMARFQAHAERFNTEFIYDQIESVDVGQRPFVLNGEQGRYSCDALIVSTGASALYLGLPSEQAYLNQGVSGCATCDGPYFKGQAVVVIGGGNVAVEEALFMTNIASHVTLVHRRDKFRADPILVDRLKAKAAEGQLDILLDHVLDEVLGDSRAVKGVRLKHVKTGAPSERAVGGVFIAIGHKPNTEMFDGQLEMNGGYLVTLGRFPGGLTATSVPGVFAAGDVQDSVYRQAITSAGSGCMAALDAQRYLDAQGW